MSLRFTPEQAANLGFISRDDATTMKKAMRTNPKRGRASSSARVDPQQILYNALCERLPGQPESEKEGLVPGRKFRADIFLPPNIVVEMDGFQYHRSKTAFQKDRDRENLMASHGYRVFRTYAKQVLDPVSLAKLVDLIAGSLEGAPVKAHL